MNGLNWIITIAKDLCLLDLCLLDLHTLSKRYCPVTGRAVSLKDQRRRWALEGGVPSIKILRVTVFVTQCCIATLVNTHRLRLLEVEGLAKKRGPGKRSKR